jgi:hypothetical protein
VSEAVVAVYFKSVSYGIANQGCNCAMFFKIWWEKGNRTNRDQIEFLKRVNKNGVPMPALMVDMTALDIDSTSAGIPQHLRRVLILWLVIFPGRIGEDPDWKYAL